MVIKEVDMSLKDGSELCWSQKAYCCEVYVSQSDVISFDMNSSPLEVN